MKELRGGTEIVLKYRNCLEFLNNRELGTTAGRQAEQEFYRMKLSHKEKLSSCDLPIPFRNDSCEVNFLKGDDKSLFGMWCVSSDIRKNNYVMGEVNYNLNNEGHVPQTYRTCHKIIDMCRGLEDFITVCSYSPYDDSPSFPDILNVHAYVHEKYSPPAWYCCCFIYRFWTTVLGGDWHVKIINESTEREQYLEFPGKVCTLSHHEPSGVFFAGLHTGMLCLKDLRTCSDAYDIKVSDNAVNDSVFVNGQEIIVTDVEGKLVKVDLRTRKTSAEFFGHKHSVTKRPFSVANDMLCATGADNVVRIWRVSGGHPIHVHKSTSGHEVRGWLHSDGNKTYLNCFERDVRTVFTI